MPTLLGLDGFAHQEAQAAQAGSGFGGLYNAVGGTPTFDTTIKRLPEHVASVVITENGSVAQNLRYAVAAGNRALNASFYFYASAAPSALSNFLLFSGPTNPPQLFMDTTGHIAWQSTNGSRVTSAGTYADSLFHRLDVKIDVSGTTFTVDLYIDGVPQTQSSAASQTAADVTVIVLGSLTAAHTLTFRAQDMVWSATAADWPIGPHVVLPLYPSGEGTETLGSTNKIQDEAAGQTTLYTKVNDWNGGTPDTAHYITYASTTTGDAASNFAEFTFQDPAKYGTIWDVAGYIAGFAAGTTADNADTQVLTAHGGTLIDHIGNLIDYSGSTTVLGYHKQFLARPAGGWSISVLSGVVVQWGRSTDTNPQPRLSAVMLEYAALEGSPTHVGGQTTVKSQAVHRASRW